MPSFFNLTLDTEAPVGLAIELNEGALFTTKNVVDLGITLTDEDTTGYQMKIWGTDEAEDEAAASWANFTESKSISLPDGDGLKTVYVKVRDDVGNETTAVSASITLDTAVPVISITGPDKTKLSKVTGFDQAVINFTSDVDFVEYKVCVVPETNSLEAAGTVLGTVNGSSNVAGVAEEGEPYPADTNITVTITGADLEVASAGDGVKTLKVFVKSAAGTWSVA